jgi:hypothetical protein
MRRLWFVLTAALTVLAGTTVMPATAPIAFAANTLPTNPYGMAYISVAGVSQYGHPTGMLITGRCNRYAPEFAAAQANGAEILAYLNAFERPDSQVCALDNEFYGGPPGSTPLWPYPTPGERVNFANMHLTDLRAGSAWADQAVSYIEGLMREDKVDGVLLDGLGARLWSTLANWDSWPQWEKDEWTAGSVDLVRRLDAKRRAINPQFILVNNNNWAGAGTLGRGGEPYVDGISIENHFATEPFNSAEAGRSFGNLGHRRVLAIGQNHDDALAWANVQGVTHVSDQENYGQVTPPPIGFHRLTDRPKTFGRTDIGTIPSSGMTADFKRASKFTLADKATLLGFSAYLDGQGGVVESQQQVRLVLYRDNAGVPGSFVAQSNTVSIASGTVGRWVPFTAPAIPVDPGAYWIAIHTGATAGVARNRGGGTPNNWYGNADTFSDGGSSPFGNPGSPGVGTLSVNVTYTVGY